MSYEDLQLLLYNEKITKKHQAAAVYQQPSQPVMYQPGPVGPGPVPGPEYGGSPGGISPAPAPAAAAVAVGVPPGLEYLTQVGWRHRVLYLDFTGMCCWVTDVM